MPPSLTPPAGVSPPVCGPLSRPGVARWAGSSKAGAAPCLCGAQGWQVRRRVWSGLAGGTSFKV